jgi:predicted anti-sigma-YlaC factor YlaD
MTIKSFRKWIRSIYGTLEDELDCEAVAQVIPRYVDLKVAGGQAEASFSKIKQHLAQCSECCDLYHALYDMALIESQEEHLQAARSEQVQVESEFERVVMATPRVTLESS